jgi:DNA-binding transcriptional MerR regulator
LHQECLINQKCIISVDTPLRGGIILILQQLTVVKLEGGAMYKIGTFSRMTGLTVKALRYYHSEDILIPEEIDQYTGYRLYKANQVATAEAIRLLRACEFSVKEIKEVILNCEDPSDILYYMAEKTSHIDLEIKRLAVIKKRLIDETEKRKVVKAMNDYEVIEKTYDEVEIISMRYTGAYDQCGKYMGEIYKTVKGAAKDVPFNLYYDDEYKEDADIEVCVPVKKAIKTEGNVVSRRLPAESGLSVIHIGPYDEVGSAYQAINDYASKHNLELTTPLREIYRKGPGMLFKGNPNKYVTEMFIPFKS